MPDISAPEYENWQFDVRYHIHTAKNSITGLLPVMGEVVSNADEAITQRSRADGKPDVGEIHVYYDPSDEVLRITDDGVGMTTATMRARLKRIGVDATPNSRRGFFHRGLREVFIALGGGTIVSIAESGGALVYTQALFDARLGMAIVVSDAPVSAEAIEAIGGEHTGTAVVLPVARLVRQAPKLFTFSEMAKQLEECVQIRPVMLDDNRAIYLHYASDPPRRIRFRYDAGESLIADAPVVVGGLEGKFWLKAASKALGGSSSRQRRRSGVLIRGERAAYEVCLGDNLKSHPAMSMIFGELRIDGIEELQRETDKSATEDAELIYKPDRSGLNPDHPLVQAIYEFIDGRVGPLLAELDARTSKPVSNPDVRRQLVKLAQIINSVLTDEAVGNLEDTGGTKKKHTERTKATASGGGGGGGIPLDRVLASPMEFSVGRVLMKTGDAREVELWLDPAYIPPGTPLEVTSKTGTIVKSVKLTRTVVPHPDADGICTVMVQVVAGAGEGRREIAVGSAGYSAELPVHVRQPRASGFITSIILDAQDWPSGAALWNPSTGVVTVYVGRPEFRSAERRAQKAKLEPMKDPLYRQLVVESIREAALREAAKRRAELALDELTPEERKDPHRFHDLVIFEYQDLDYRLRNALLESFVQAA